MLTLFLNREGLVPLYEQIYRGIRERIESGQLGQSERLPSKRGLAQELGVSPITVENAYAQLVAEGYLRSLPKRGFFVEPHVRPFEVAKPIEAVFIREKPAFRYDFKTNVVDPTLFPFAIWSRLGKESLLREGAELINTSDPQGSLTLRTEIALVLARHRGVHAHPDQIVVGSGTEALLGLVVRLLGYIGPVALENPGYGKVAKTFQSLNLPIIALPLDEQGLRVDELEKAEASLVHLTPSHQFPSGVVMPVGRRLDLIRWAQAEKKRYVIEDDYDSEFRFSGLPISALQGLDPAGKVLYLNSFSKSLAPSLRIGYLVLPWELVTRFRTESPAFTCSVPLFEQAILAAFLREGEFDRHLNRMKKSYREKRDALIEGLRKSAFGNHCQIRNHDAGLHFLVEIDNEMSEIELVESAKSQGVRVYGLSEYALDETIRLPEKTLVIGYSGLQIGDFPEAIRRMESAWCPPLQNPF